MQYSTYLSYSAVKARNVTSPKPELILANTTPDKTIIILVPKATVMKLAIAKVTITSTLILIMYASMCACVRRDRERDGYIINGNETVRASHNSPPPGIGG